MVINVPSGLQSITNPCSKKIAKKSALSSVVHVDGKFSKKSANKHNVVIPLIVDSSTIPNLL